MQSLTKTEIGGSTIDAYDRLNEIFTLEFINNWYNNKSAEYKSYDPDPNLGTYGKIYRLKYDPTVNRNYILDTANPKIQTSDGTDNHDLYDTAMFYSPIKNWGIENGDYIVSFDWTLKTALSSDMQASVLFNSSPWQQQFFTVKAGQLTGHTNLNFKLNPGILTATNDVTGLTFRIMSQMASGNTITYSDLFMKSGTSGYWTPAPEDNQIIPSCYAYAGLHG